MAVFEYYQDMHDVRLKPRLLRSLLKNYLPNEQHPIPNPSELSSVVSSIKTHGLLSESFTKPVEGKLMEKWKSTVDDWINGLLTLVSSKMPDKCWVGICLLGITCQECSDDRFLLSHSLIFQELLSQIQPPSNSHFVKVAACASLSDLFTRLGGFPTLKKDASSKAGKLIPPIVKLLSEEASEAVLEGAVELLCTLINFFPYSVHRHYDNVESVIVSKIMSGKYTANMSKKLAYCLALLPRTKGDEESWSLMMQKILISLSVHLNDVFQGLEEEDKSNEVIRFLVPPGKDPPPPLGGQLSVEAANQAANRSEQMLLSTVSTLMKCCCLMLTNPTSVQVTVPVRPLLALVRRVLLVDGSVSQSLMRFMTVMQQEFICLELPGLHAHSLDILTAIIKGVNSQLLPYGIDIVRLLTEYFRRCALPALRIKVYSIVQILLISVGVGITRYLDQEVIENAFIDLDSVGHVNCVASPNPSSKVATYALPQHSNRKRKHATGEHQNGVNKGMEPPKNKPTAPISVQIAALQALEALLAVGGALLSGSQRSSVDLLLITVATNACDGGWANKEKGAFISSAEITSNLADFQLAAFHALLASLLSPARVRPPYLSQGLELFRKGRQQTGTKLAESCVLALSALEVLIHPRALPLTDHLSSNYNTFDEGYNRREDAVSGAQQHKSPFSRGGLGMDDPDADDDLYKSWLGNGEETEAPVGNTDKQMEDANEPSQNGVQKSNIDYPTGNGIIEILQNVNRVLNHSSDVEMEESRNTLLDQIEKTQISISHGDLGTSVEKGVAILTGSSRDGELENIAGQRDNDALNHSTGIISSSNDLTTGLELASSRRVTASGGDVAMPGEGVASFTTEPVFGEGKGIIVLGDDSDLDSFPDIVDGDPDTE